MNGIDMKLVRLALEEYVSNHRVDEDKNKEKTKKNQEI